MICRYRSQNIYHTSTLGRYVEDRRRGVFCHPFEAGKIASILEKEYSVSTRLLKLL
jgi:hypothetical protein